MVIGVQAFDELAVHGGGIHVLPLDTLFDGIAQSPAAPEYWWVYALLLSSMIPSLINLAIGGMAFTSGIPGLPSLLLTFMPAAKAVPGFDRAWMALVLTGQMFAGAFLGIAAQAFLAWGLIFHADATLADFRAHTVVATPIIESRTSAKSRYRSLIGQGRLCWFGWLALPSGDCVLCVLDGA
jgi:hypothetical protein